MTVRTSSNRASKNAATYGRRGRQTDFNSGVRPVSPTFGKRRIHVNSDKCGGEIIVESWAEKVATQVFAVDPTVREFSPQPFTLNLATGEVLDTQDVLNEAKRLKAKYGFQPYTPDFLVRFHREPNPLALEVKLEGFEGDQAYQCKLQKVKDQLSRHGIDLARLVVSADKTDPLVRNLVLLSGACKQELPVAVKTCFEQFTSRCDSDEFECLDVFADEPDLRNYLAHLVIKGALELDIVSTPLNGYTSVKLAHGSLSHLEILRRVRRDV